MSPDFYESRFQEINNRLTSQDNKIKDIDDKLVGKALLCNFDDLDERLKQLEYLADSQRLLNV